MPSHSIEREIKVASGSEVRVGTSALASALIAPLARWPRSGLRFRPNTAQ
jgi:hypothetical protein